MYIAPPSALVSRLDPLQSWSVAGCGRQAEQEVSVAVSDSLAALEFVVERGEVLECWIRPCRDRLIQSDAHLLCLKLIFSFGECL